jgi:hypothetical protein
MTNRIITTILLAATVAQADEMKLWRHLRTEMASSVTQGWRETRTDSANGGGALTIAGQRYAKGLGTHAPGEMVFPLNGKHRQFQACVGVDDAGDARGSVVFRVLLDGNKVVDSLKTRFGIRLFEMRGKNGLFVNNCKVRHFPL